MSLIELVGIGSLGVAIGYMFGLLTKRFLSPRNQELVKIIEENEIYHKQQLGRLKKRLGEYEQPGELQRLAQNTKNLPVDDIVGLLSNELPNIRGLPKWLRPMIPGIQAYLKENPEQVTELITKFTQ